MGDASSGETLGLWEKREKASHIARRWLERTCFVEWDGDDGDGLRFLPLPDAIKRRLRQH